MLYRLSDHATGRATVRPFAALRLLACLSGRCSPIAQGDKGVKYLSLPVINTQYFPETDPPQPTSGGKGPFGKPLLQYHTW